MTKRLKTIKTPNAVWPRLRVEAAAASGEEPALASFLHEAILNHHGLGEALSYQLAQKLGGGDLNALQLREICVAALDARPDIATEAEADMLAVLERDPACRSLLQPFLFFKGYLALQAHRVAHWLWDDGRDLLAFAIQSRVSELFQVDIHPAARIGSGVFTDHATGVVIGETAVVGDDVSMLHGVTLGGTKAIKGDRHPKIGKGVLLGAGAKVLAISPWAITHGLPQGQWCSNPFQLIARRRGFRLC